MMRGIEIGAEHGSETAAGAFVDSPKKLFFLPTTAPVFGQCDAPAISQNKAGDINRICPAMFGQAVRSGDPTTAITAHSFNSHQLAAQILARRAADGIFSPCGKFVGEFASHGSKVGNFGTAPDIQHCDRVDLAAPTGEILIGQGGEADAGLPQLPETLLGTGARIDFSAAGGWPFAVGYAACT